MREPIELQEYQSADCGFSRATAEALAALAGDRLTVGLGAEPGTWRVTATQYVGAIVVDDVSVLISPKVRTENLFALLGVGMPANSWLHESFDFGASPDLLAAVATFFARSAELATSQGLLRAYRREDDRLLTVRGRIDMAQQVRRPDLAPSIACTFEEFTDDVIENRALKAACRRLLRVPLLQPEVRRLLHRLLAAFADVTDSEVRPELIDRVHFNRLNAHYEAPLRLAQLILRNLSLVDSTGVHRSSCFLVNMNDLFQRFVTDRLRRALVGRLDVDPEPETQLLQTRPGVTMSPDLVFRERGAAVYVGDTKYKLAESGVGRASDYYQMLAYCTALDLPEGVLIYCQTSGDAPSREATVRHSGHRLLTYPVDLTGPPTEVEQAVERLADFIVDRARLAPT
jgi:5-methylcytosine-specific restriction enzyme subunit McrC